MERFDETTGLIKRTLDLQRELLETGLAATRTVARPSRLRQGSA